MLFLGSGQDIDEQRMNGAGNAAAEIYPHVFQCDSVPILVLLGGAQLILEQTARILGLAYEARQLRDLCLGVDQFALEPERMKL
jgi:hypothetical protein